MDAVDPTRRMRRGWLVALVAAALAATLAGTLLYRARRPATSPPAQRPAALRPELPAPADPAAWNSCTADRLPAGSNPDVRVIGGDSTGRWQIGATGSGDDDRAMVWHDGKLAAEADKNHAAVNLTGINSSGVAVGTDQSKDIAKGGPPVDEVPYVYRNGTFSRLAGGHGRAIAINDAGVIAGELDYPGSTRPVRWKTPEANPELLSLPAGSEGGGVWDVAPDGTIAGFANTGPGYRWPADGTVHRIEPPTTPGLQSTGVLSGGKFRFGWLIVGVYVYYEDPSVNASRAPSDRVRGERPVEFRYRSQPAGWQLLSDGNEAAPDAEASPSPGVWVGQARRALPPAAGLKSAAYRVPYISEDGHTAAGTAGAPGRPIIWHCR